MPCSQWNTLEVPLDNGWQCVLIPAGQYRDALWLQQGSRIQPYPLRRPRWGWPDSRDALHYAIDRTRQIWRDDHERQRWERDELARQRDEDRGDFYRYFRPNDDLRSITGQRGLETIQAFLSDILGFVHWNQPKTNDDIRRRTSGPERWKASAGGGDGAVAANAVPVITYDEFVALQRANGELPPLVPDGDAERIAGMPFNGEPGTWISSMPSTMSQMRQYGPNCPPLTDFDLEAHHGNPDPHAHNWDGYDRDEGAPVSLLPW